MHTIAIESNDPERTDYSEAADVTQVLGNFRILLLAACLNPLPAACHICCGNEVYILWKMTPEYGKYI